MTSTELAAWLRLAADEMERLNKVEEKYVDGQFWKTRAESAWEVINAIADRLGVVHEDETIKAAALVHIDKLRTQRDVAITERDRLVHAILDLSHFEAMSLARQSRRRA